MKRLEVNWRPSSSYCHTKVIWGYRKPVAELILFYLFIGPDQFRKAFWEKKGRGNTRNLSSKVNNPNSCQKSSPVSWALLVSSLFIWRGSLFICFKEGLIIHSWHYSETYTFLACTEHPISWGMLLSPRFSVVRSAINLICTPGSLVLLLSQFLHWISQAMYMQSPKVHLDSAC